jgi:DNA-cytosine methyltransferase
MTKLRLATLFSGIGAPEQAAFRVFDSVEHVFACEIDHHARKSYLNNYMINGNFFISIGQNPLDLYKPIVYSCDFILSNIFKNKMLKKTISLHKKQKPKFVSFSNIPTDEYISKKYKDEVDILVGGSPCQDFSIAGKRAGFGGFRGSLTGEFVRVVSEVMPKVFLFENVPGITGPKFKEGLKTFIQELRDIGYHLHIENANTKHYGVPQNRDRFFITGFLDAEAYALFEYAPKQPLTKRLKDVLEQNVSDKYYLSQKALDGYTAHGLKHKAKGNGFMFKPTNGGGTALCLSTLSGSRPTDNYLLRAIPDNIQKVININPSGHGMNGEVIGINGVSSAMTTNKGEGIKIAGLLNIKGTEQIRRVYETGGGKPHTHHYARRPSRTEDTSKDYP